MSAARPGALLPFAAIAALALGSLGIACGVLGFAFAGTVPAVVRYANMAGAAVEIGLGLGLRRADRASWAFAVSLEGTLTLINLISLPQMADAGMVGAVSIAFAVARTALGVVLVLAADEAKI